MDYTKQSPVILSLCSGMRGLERGFDRACKQLGWQPHRTEAYVEIEAFIAWNLVKQMEQGVLDPAPVHTNIKTFDGKPFHGKIHGIFGGYPCQPFSHLGKQQGAGDPRHLWPYIGQGRSSLIGTIRPVFCWFENVRNHINIGFDIVYKDLCKLGYKVEAGIYTALECGGSHLRERLFILTVDYSQCKGLERYSWNESSAEGWEKQKRSIGQAGVFPLPQGISQGYWEEPRINFRDEPGLGTSINGYNFREDLLRMAGNGVVEQTAELAFIDLYKKFKL